MKFMQNIIASAHTNTLPYPGPLCCAQTNSHLYADVLPNKTSGYSDFSSLETRTTGLKIV